MVFEKTLSSPSDCKEIQPVHPKGIQSWMFIGRTDVEAEIPIFWPPDVKSWLIWKDPDVGNDCRGEKKGTAEDEMIGWHHRLNGHGFGRHDWATELNWLGFVLANEIQVEGLFASFKVLLIIQLCLILWDPMDCSLPDSSVYGIIQARILKW